MFEYCLLKMIQQYYPTPKGAVSRVLVLFQKTPNVFGLTETVK